MTRGELARQIYELSHLTGKFTLRSGTESTEYFDKYLFEAHPKTLLAVAEALKPLVPADTEVLAGLETGGIPIATILSQVTGLPTAFIRKQAKAYGTARLAEGAVIEGKNVLIIEDIVTSGGQILLSAGEMRERGAKIERVLCVIDRQAGGPEKLAEENLHLSALFTMSELKDAAVK